MLRSQGDRRFYTEVKEGANLHLDGGHGKSSQGIFLLLLLCGGKGGTEELGTRVWKV